mmetsp:Transcript_14309/g.23839  ORF Transcript_14309/g.23839 Transcript_14309/m.23839 type:complete len:84 (+) Transcript_14309:445-696(+)
MRHVSALKHAAYDARKCFFPLLSHTPDCEKVVPNPIASRSIQLCTHHTDLYGKRCNPTAKRDANRGQVLIRLSQKESNLSEVN